MALPVEYVADNVCGCNQRELPDWESYANEYLNKDSLAYASLISVYLSKVYRPNYFEIRHVLHGNSYSGCQLGWSPITGQSNVVSFGMQFGFPDLKFISDVFFRNTLFQDEVDFNRIKSNLGLYHEDLLVSCTSYKTAGTNVQDRSTWEVSRNLEAGLIELSLQTMDTVITTINTLRVYRYLCDLLVGDQMHYKYTIGYLVRPEVRSIVYIENSFIYETADRFGPLIYEGLIENQNSLLYELGALTTCGQGKLMHIDFTYYLWDDEEIASRTSSLYR